MFVGPLVIHMMNFIAYLSKNLYFGYSILPAKTPTFFGTQSSYDASVSSGRLTYFGNDELSNEIGKIYSHHYYRIHYNGELLDKTYFRELPILVTGALSNKAKIRQENTKIIKTHTYITEVQLKEEIQRIYILRCNAGVDQIKKVIQMLNEELN